MSEFTIWNYYNTFANIYGSFFMQKITFWYSIEINAIGINGIIKSINAILPNVSCEIPKFKDYYKQNVVFAAQITC